MHQSDNTAPTPGAGSVPHVPQGWARLAALGPGFLWMVSAAGSGELLFTPRIAAQYGYVLLWALLLAVALKWFINREVGRYTVCTGMPLLEGFKQLPGPRNWAVWLIVIPQVLVGVAAMAGMASSAATALILVLPGHLNLWTIAAIVSAMAMVVWGRYARVELVARVIALALALASIIAAVSVGPDLTALGAGLIPSLPDTINYGEVLPWLGYMLSGAAGMMWYSYWLRAKGYGAAGRPGNAAPLDLDRLEPETRRRLKGWLKQMTLDTTVAVVGALIVTVAFLILGAELLRPRGLIPDEEKVAQTLGVLLGGVFGTVGYWFMISGVFFGFWDTVLADQDGHGRLLSNGTRILASAAGMKGRWLDEAFLKTAFVVVLLTVIPIVLFLMVGQPVTLLKAAGIIEAAHIPVVAWLTLYLNRRSLPPGLAPSLPTFLATALSGLFFAAFTLIYIADLIWPGIMQLASG